MSSSIVRPDLDSINTPSTSTTTPNKTPTDDPLPPSNLTDIESFDNDHEEIPIRSGSSSNAPSIAHVPVRVKLSELDKLDSNSDSFNDMNLKPITPLSFHHKRESVLSTFSQYSGQVDENHAVPMTLERQDSTKIKYVQQNYDIDYEDDEEEPEEQQEEQESINTNDMMKNDDDESDYEQSSIIMGKLPTSKNDTQERLIPDKSFNTNIEGAIPARSPNRPKSMIYEKDKLVNQHNRPKSMISEKMTNKRQSVINDDLDRLMLDASSFNSKDFNDETINDSQQQQILPKNRQPSHSSSILPPRPSRDSIRKAREASQSMQKRTEPENDDDYVDIEDVEPVKKSIKSKKGKKTKKNDLKPFSYNTLISLLESMNGTIIGEEFNQLAIPMKEKQLIEKIIDSLSRLTSDMILDQQRYDIGITRLEKAIRVLEGFM